MPTLTTDRLVSGRLRSGGSTRALDPDASVRPLDPDGRSLTGWHAVAIYLAAAIVWSWPLAPNITRSIAWDLGDPMFVAWTMGWVNDSFVALARGDMQRFLALWDAPIFHPQHLTLASSEHMIPQALLSLPVHALTGNVILSYNAALLITFVLSGVGMFLLVRELTGGAAAALLAGAVFAFMPYRVDQLSHLHILSSQWMPFALYGLRRYFVTQRMRPLVGATLALVAQSLSTGYYLFFFAPFVAAYALAEIWSRGRLRSPRTWTHMLAAAVATVLLTLPFLIPYLALRAETVVEARELAEVESFAADIYAYATSSMYVGWWGDALRAIRGRPENATFPGAIALLFTAGAGAMLIAQAGRRWKIASARDGVRGLAVLPLVLIALACAGMIVWIAINGGRIVHVAEEEIRLRNIPRFVMFGAAALAIAAALSPRLRAAFRGPRGSLACGAIAAAAVAFLLSLGPRMESMGRYVGQGPYLVLYQYVPGFDGLRVPSRFAMLVMLWMAIAGGYAAAVLTRTFKYGAVIVLMAALIAMAESAPRRFMLDEAGGDPGVAPMAMRHRLALAEPLYMALRQLPRGVLLELPFGTTGWDLQYMHAQRRHGWPLVNGYTGHFPPAHTRNSAVRDALDAPVNAWRALERSGASHVIVHEWAFQSIERGQRVSQWLRDSGAVEVASTENDRLFRLPGGIKHR